MDSKRIPLFSMDRSLRSFFAAATAIFMIPFPTTTMPVYESLLEWDGLSTTRMLHSNTCLSQGTRCSHVSHGTVIVLYSCSRYMYVTLHVCESGDTTRERERLLHTIRPRVVAR